MKKIIIAFAAFCALFAVSCTKESSVLKSSETSLVSIPLSIEVSAPGEEYKTTLDPSSYSQNWVSGDSIMLASYLKGAKNGTNAYNKLGTSGSGSSAYFSGKNVSFTEEMLQYYNSDNKLSGNYTANYIISPLFNWVRGATNSQFVNIPVLQSGKIEDFGKYCVSFSKSFVLKKIDEEYSVPPITKMYNLCPAIKFNIAAGLDVRKIVISGYEGSTQKTLAAEKSDGGIQLKLGGPQLYGTNSSVKSLTIDRNPKATTLSEKEEISGDVYAVLAPNFPQDATAHPGLQWGDLSKRDFYIYKEANGLTEEQHRPYNSCDALVFTFYNSKGDSCIFPATLNTHLYSGKIKNLGSISKNIFQTCSFSIDSKTGNLLCASSDNEVKLYYSYTKNVGKNDPAEPVDPVVNEESLFPEGGLEFADSLAMVKIKVLPVKNGVAGIIKNAYLKKFNAVDNRYDAELMKNQSSDLGFVHFTNNGYGDQDTVKVTLTYSSNGYHYRHLGTNSGRGIKNRLDYMTGSFSSKYNNVPGIFYIKLGGSTARAIYYKYQNGKNTQIIPTATKIWFSSDNTKATTVASGEATLTLYADYNYFAGFAWLEQGFSKF